MESVYLETTIIGYLAMRPSRDLLVAANQQVTHDWWTNHRSGYELYVSQSVLDECAAGGPAAAAERMIFLDGITVLQLDSMVRKVSGELMTVVGLPQKAVYDSVHIAIAARNNVDFLLTWNCRHIANPSLRRRIEKVLESNGLKPPIICTPQELLGV